jgi:hypothetical protein
MSSTIRGGMTARWPGGDPRQERPQAAPAPGEVLVVAREALRQRARLRDAREEPRDQALFLVLVVVDGRGVEVAQDRARRGARIGIAAVLGQVALEPRERGELLADAAVAGDEHRERLVVGGGVGGGKRVHGGFPDHRRASAPQGDLVTATDTM